MIFTETLTSDEIKNKLNKDDVIAIIGCSSCARMSGTGGEKQMKDLAMQLRGEGFNVKEGFSINTVCTPKVLQAKLDRKVDTVITLCCSAGCSNATQIFANHKVVRGCSDVGLMTANKTNGTVRVAMPYKNYKDTKGNVYKMFTGELVNNNSLNEDGEVGK